MRMVKTFMKRKQAQGPVLLQSGQKQRTDQQRLAELEDTAIHTMQTTQLTTHPTLTVGG